MTDETKDQDFEVELSTSGGGTVKTTMNLFKKVADKLRNTGQTNGPWAEAPNSIIDLAQEIIYDYHRGLLEARIGFLIRTEPSKSKGKRVYAKAEKVSSKHQLLLDLDFLIWIDEEIWSELGDEQRKALIDHELCHCRYNLVEQKGEIVGHDVEEFNSIIERYGAWNADLVEFSRRKDKGEITNFANRTEQLVQQMSMLPPRGSVVAVDPAAVPVDTETTI